MQFRTDDFSCRYIVHNENILSETKVQGTRVGVGADLTVYVLPISGGKFVSQLALLSEIYDGGQVRGPDLIFSTSGGNICAYAAMAGGWSPEGIKRTVSFIRPSMFCRSWYPRHLDWMPSWTQGIPMYRCGTGAEELFRSIFMGPTITRTEIWTGTYDETQAKSQFFCNRFQQDSMIDADRFSETAFLYGVLPLKWCDGNVDKLAKVSIASASIPMIVPGQKIEDSTYSDGGLTYSSPLIPFAHELIRLIRDGDRRLRLCYFAAYHLESPRHLTDLGLAKTMVTQFIHLNTLEDRCAAVNLLYRIVSPSAVRHYSHHHMTTVGLRRLLDFLSSKKHYVLILYPHQNEDGSVVGVPIRSFRACDVYEKIAYVRSRYGIQVWYC